MFSRKDLLATVKRSPQAVAAHEKAAWLALFTDDAQVHDPVGSRGHGDALARDRFYDTFIAPNNIEFRVEHDIVCGSTVVRDLVIHTHMGGTNLQVNVPLFIRYEVVEQAGQLRVHRLYAHWELLPMMTGQVFSQGVGNGVLALFKLTGNMLRHQGISGALGFSRGFIGVGAKAKARAELCLQALAQGDSGRLQELLAPDASLYWGDQEIKASDLLQKLCGLRWEKALAGGKQVTARLLHEQGPSVALFDFSKQDCQIQRLRIYSNAN